jgi:hypothetical protein
MRRNITAAALLAETMTALAALAAKAGDQRDAVMFRRMVDTMADVPEELALGFCEVLQEMGGPSALVQRRATPDFATAMQMMLYFLEPSHAAGRDDEGDTGGGDAKQQ